MTAADSFEMLLRSTDHWNLSNLIAQRDDEADGLVEEINRYLDRQTHAEEFGPYARPVVRAIEVGHSPPSLLFSDGSSLQLRQMHAALDDEVHLLEVLTTAEYQGVEAILGRLWRAIEDNELSDVHAAQIQAMAQLIESARQGTRMGESKRWELVGVVKAALRYLYKDLPKDALAWRGLIETLADIHWHRLAEELSRALR